MPDAWHACRKILAVRLDQIGDLLMTTPALRAIKETLPDVHLALLTSPAGTLAAKLIPEIDATIVYEAPWMKASKTLDAKQHLSFVKRLAAEKFDGAIIFNVFSQDPLPAALLCTLAAIRLRLAQGMFKPYQLLTHWLAETDTLENCRHETRRQLDLVASVGFTTKNARLSLAVSPAADARLRRLLACHGIDDARALVVIHPGASAASRRYPPQHFARVVQLLRTACSETAACEIVITGTHCEAELAAQIADGKSHSLCGELDFEALCALIARADLLISNNTAPAHVAAAVGTPVVDLYALTNPQHTPWMVRHRVLSHDVPCRNCQQSICPQGHQQCLSKVTPESVVAAARELLFPMARQKRSLVSGEAL